MTNDDDAQRCTMPNDARADNDDDDDEFFDSFMYGMLYGLCYVVDDVDSLHDDDDDR